MKNILLIISLLFLQNTIIAQIAIGKETIDGDGILDFVQPATGGIALPKIIGDMEPTPAPGTLYFDTSDRKVKGILNGDGEVMIFNPRTHPSQNEFDFDRNGYGSYTENDNSNGLVIGANTANAPGVLVLETVAKALILPKLDNPHLSIIDPEPGMIVYDTINKVLCVYNGIEWAFWGESPNVSVN